MFWGRSSFYRTSFHLTISIITIVALISGVSSRLNIISANDTQGLDLTSGVIGRQDIFSQSGTAESISSVSEDEVDYRIFRHKVQEGETLSPVSYTHLDVYKRQSISYPVKQKIIPLL